jgi:peptide/nickel transport system substrate-binding protein
VFYLVLTLVFVLALVGPTAAQDENVLQVVFQQELDTLNPMYTQMWFASTAQDLIFAPSWYIDNELNPVPVLVTEIPSAENGGLSEDGTVITLNLRDDIVWSDGEPITSADFVFAYEMMIDPANTPNSRFTWDSAVASVEAPDERTVVVTFNESATCFLPSEVFSHRSQSTYCVRCLRPRARWTMLSSIAPPASPAGHSSLRSGKPAATSA